MIHSQRRILRIVAQHHGRTVPRRDVEASARADGRSEDEIAEAVEPQRFAAKFTRGRIEPHENVLVVAQVIERVVVEQRRGNVGRQAVEFPHHVRARADVAARAREADGQHRLRVVAVARNDQAAPINRRGDDIVRESRAFPDQRPRREVVAAHALGGAHDDLRFPFDLDDERRGPRSLFVACDFPTLLSGVFVEGVEERTAFVIPVHDQHVAVQHGRTAFAVRVERLHPAQVRLPPHRAVRVEAVKPARTEEGINELTIGDRRVRGRTARVVPAFVRPFLAQDFFPEHPPVGPAQGQRQILVGARHRDAVMHARRGVVHRPLLRSDRRGRHHINAVPENNGRGMAPAGQRDFPTHVLLLAPLHGRGGVRRDAIGLRPAPLRPMVQTVRRRMRGSGSGPKQKCQHQPPERRRLEMIHTLMACEPPGHLLPTPRTAAVNFPKSRWWWFFIRWLG